VKGVAHQLLNPPASLTKPYIKEDMQVINGITNHTIYTWFVPETGLSISANTKQGYWSTVNGSIPIDHFRQWLVNKAIPKRGGKHFNSSILTTFMGEANEISHY